MKYSPCLYNLFKASPDQQHPIGNLVLLLKHGSFLRSTNGLNSLQTFKKFASILQKPNGLEFNIEHSDIQTFINKSTLCKSTKPHANL